MGQEITIGNKVLPYLGYYNLKKKNGINAEMTITKHYLVVVEAGYLQITVNDLEDILSCHL
ncbi:hypothetical protein ACFO26_01580 [Lactococcus nasutitermitis]|uniref:Uncharacterized protein n=1 Tax=Lactococcus nasutitermitis TaxID=1652957 RepID=A0ABV9JA99_9LACT|nr:hypothetical protein [Lactococcus nasutitermitis]